VAVADARQTRGLNARRVGDGSADETASVARAIEAAFAALTTDEATARKAFAACVDVTCERGDAAAQRLVAAGALLAIAIEYADFRGLSAWLSRFEPARRASWPRAPRDVDQARIDAALLVVPLLSSTVATDDPVVADAAERLTTRLADDDFVIAPDERVLLWKCLVDYRMQRLDATAIARIAARAQDHLRVGGVGPLWQARWWLLVARDHEYFGAADAAFTALDRARDLAETHALASVRYELLCVEMTGALKVEAWSRAETIAREIELAMPDIRSGRLPAGLRAQAWRLLWLGQPAAALQRLDTLLAICDDVEVPRRDRGAYHVLRAYALMALDRFDDATRELEAQCEHQRGVQRDLLDLLIELAAGLGGVHHGQPTGPERVLGAIRRCAAHRFERFMLPLPSLAAEAAEIALEAGVEREFVAAVVRSRKLVPRDVTREDWPWRLHVRAFGSLEILRDGQPLPFAGKRPKKALELLALVVAQGRQPLALDRAIDTLWPSLDAEAPKASFEAALSRLRKLLDVPGVLILGDGGLRLDLRMVWTDVATFETLEQRWLDGQPLGTGDDSARAAIALYRGALLAGDTGPSTWMLAREQLARRFNRIVLGYGTRLETQGRWREAVDVYERGIARDVLAEPLYRALMRAQLELDERAEALRTFARCRDLLFSVLGASPAAETVVLRERAMRD